MRKSPTNNGVVRLAGPLPHHGSKLEQDERLRGPDATVLKAPNVVELAAGRERARRGALTWTGEGTQLWYATVRLGTRRTVHMLVERLGGAGWDWHVWVRAGPTWSRYGLAKTAKCARKRAERALMGLMRSDAGGDAPLGPNGRFVLVPQPLPRDPAQDPPRATFRQTSTVSRSELVK